MSVRFFQVAIVVFVVIELGSLFVARIAPAIATVNSALEHRA